jgi:hypothetical protein
MQLIAVHVPERAATFESPLMVCTSDAVRRVFAAGAEPVVPLPSPGIFGKLRPPDEGVGVGPVVEPPQAAIPAIAPRESAPSRSRWLVIDFLVSCVGARSAESAPIIAVA